jgi:hypothetical protein
VAGGGFCGPDVNGRVINFIDLNFYFSAQQLDGTTIIIGIWSFRGLISKGHIRAKTGTAVKWHGSLVYQGSDDDFGVGI